MRTWPTWVVFKIYFSHKAVIGAEGLRNASALACESLAGPASLIEQGVLGPGEGTSSDLGYSEVKQKLVRYLYLEDCR